MPSRLRLECPKSTRAAAIGIRSSMCDRGGNLIWLTMSFGGRTILNGLNLTIQSGERVVVLGPSGCGKSTLLRLIAGLSVPTRGTVSFDGTIASRDGQILVPPERRGLSYVFQDLALWPHMTVFENVEFPLKAKRESAAWRQRRVREVLSLAGLDTLGERFPVSLSGGEQQRVAICRALDRKSVV